ncbi:hypothetical protein [Oryzifoliimicrobium ureilyticus]|uniref:hypothetical protein n=1 Tax=Oryzifoliimicrobium ureilyticus TaxID=3113724 RepID=UPI003075F5C6
MAQSIMMLFMAGCFATADAETTKAYVYPLKEGIYVQDGSDCRSAPNAAIRAYDGRGISDPHSRACRARIISKDGDRYTVDQSCLDAGAGPAKRVSERQTIIIADMTTFQLIQGRAKTKFRFCPESSLPDGISPQR